MSNFVHLHTHSEYSMLSGAMRINDLLAKAHELNMDSIALTDHGNMFGTLEFYNAAQKSGIKPIIGCDLFITEDLTKRDYTSEEPLYHRLILIAQTNTGYKNLLQICSEGYMKGFLQKPRISHEVLSKYSDGLICLTSNYQGELGYHLLKGETKKAERLLDNYVKYFTKENIYLCLQNHGLEEEQTINKIFHDLHKNAGYQLVADNDTHYINREDSEAHDILICIDGGWKLDDPQRPRFCSNQYYMRSPEEMATLFGNYPGAIENTVKIADSCNVEIEFGKLYWPKCPIPPEFESDFAYLTHLSKEGLKKRFETVTDDMMQRLEFELDIMKKMDVSGYMLIVEDFINAAKQMDIPVGPGRGSAVGSLVSYAIGITDINPLRFNLLFERFLNPERVSMPDIDTDFSDLDRGKVIKYVVDKYGSESVAQIVTYGRMKAKMVLRDVGRVMGFEAQEINRICKLFPPDKPFAKLQEAIDSSPDLKKELEASSRTDRLQEIALKLEGLVRQAGMHAAAVIIAPEPVINFAPLFKQPDSEQIMIQYDKHFSEDIGLLKMDFLGLRNLSVIKDCISQIEKDTGNKLDPLEFPEKDPKTLDLFGQGQTVGVFQFESGGMQDYLRKLKPSGIEDLIAMNALYRPGPIENIPSYIARKNGSEDLDYFHPDLKDILGETYGVIVYQEQVMQIAQVLSGFTLGGADEMRRAMAKKKEEKMAELKPKFVNGAVERGYTKNVAEKIWDVLVPFSSYAFNKSHSAAYATISYQTGYLKAHFPAQFMAANMTSELNDTDRLVILLNDCRQMGIEVNGPNVNESAPVFVSRNNAIVYGLAGIKNVGVGAATSIMKERKANGPFTNIGEFCRRIDTSELNRRAVESLILAGALDELSGNRAQQFASVEQSLLIAQKYQHDQEIGQTSLFQVDDEDDSGLHDELVQPDVEPWPYNEMLAKEKEVLGLYLSGHPLETYRMELKAFTSSPLDADSLGRLTMDTDVILGGILSGLRTRISKRDNRVFAFGVLEDFTGKTELVFWSDVYEKVRENIELDAILLVHGKIKRDDNNPQAYKLIVNRVLPITEARARLTQGVHVKLATAGLQKETLKQTHMLASRYDGNCSFFLHMELPDTNTHIIKSENIKVTADKDFTTELEKIAGKERVWISK
ncbi:MAG: DNA polymerase III subunit alpha [Fibrobacteria bacterium]|nr:DNA polymerase III subunit alpha [Fibrobacteria bacterium]